MNETERAALNATARASFTAADTAFAAACRAALDDEHAANVAGATARAISCATLGFGATDRATLDAANTAFTVVCRDSRAAAHATLAAAKATRAAARAAVRATLDARGKWA